MANSRFSSLTHPLWLALLGLILGLAGAFAAYGIGRALRPARVLRGAMLDPAIPAVDFTLQDEDGNDRSLLEFRGQIVLLTFSCIDCPKADKLLNTLSSVRNFAVSKGYPTQVVSIDVGKCHETSFSDYVQTYDPEILALIGESKDIQDLAHSYDIYFEADDPTPELIPLIMLIDDQGYWRAIYPLALSAEDIAGDIKVLLEME